MKKITQIFRISILFIFSLLIFSNISIACFNPTDSFATEVALNKPSITYDLSKIKQSKDVIVIEKEESPDVVEVVYKEETAGWNSKIRCFNGEWVQGITEEMSEETGMYMVKSLGSCGGFPIELLNQSKIGPSYDINERLDGVYEERDGDTIASIHKITKSFVFSFAFLIAIISGITGLILCKIKNTKSEKKALFCKIFGLIIIAFLSGVVFQLFFIIILDVCGIDILLGIFMLPLLFILPTLISIIISHFYHKNKIDIILTAIATFIFTIITLNMVAIGWGWDQIIRFAFSLL